jgi:hypothetical protein
MLSNIKSSTEKIIIQETDKRNVAIERKLKGRVNYGWQGRV